MLQGFLDFFRLTAFTQVTWQMMVMWAVVLVLLYLAVYRGFEPLLLVPIAFGGMTELLNSPTKYSGMVR